MNRLNEFKVTAGENRQPDKMYAFLLRSSRYLGRRQANAFVDDFESGDTSAWSSVVP